jgi:hypothetical protein
MTAVPNGLQFAVLVNPEVILGKVDHRQAALVEDRDGNVH